MSSELAVDPMHPLVLRAMRLAERAHRGQRRKAWPGADRPGYFLHLVEVAWTLQAAGMDPATVAAGFLHDVLEDGGYTKEGLAEAIGEAKVADLVQWVSEPEKSKPWAQRKRAYIVRLRTAPPEALAVSCADKSANMREMLEALHRNQPLEAYLSAGPAEQLRILDALGGLYRGRVPAVLARRFFEQLAAFKKAVRKEARDPGARA